MNFKLLFTLKNLPCDCVFYPHGIHIIPCPDVGEKVLKTRRQDTEGKNIKLKSSPVGKNIH